MGENHPSSNGTIVEETHKMALNHMVVHVHGLFAALEVQRTMNLTRTKCSDFKSRNKG